MQTKTKIIATLGPASSDEGTIRLLIEQGVNVFRLNFSHGDFDSHLQRLQTINKIRETLPFSVAVMGDLCGPKIRLGDVADEPVIVEEGDQIILTNKPEMYPDKKFVFTTNYPALTQDVEPGDRVLIDDGQIALGVSDKNRNSLTCRVMVGGPISSRKGINLPDSDVSTPAITKRDWECVDWAIQNNLDYLALSFVRNAEEITTLKNYINGRESSIRVVSKIEKPQAIENLEEILKASDAALIARGDLGVEMPLEELPLLQKRITARCRKLGKPVIVATQMLQSMIDCPVPTRAEVSDVANAIMDYTDAIMLSGETAVGKYPIMAVKTMSRICKATEKYLDDADQERPTFETKDYKDLAVFARSAAEIIDRIKVDLVAAWTDKGATARLLSKSRIDVPILVLCEDQGLANRLSLNYGLISRSCKKPNGMEDFLIKVKEIAKQQNLVRPGGEIIIFPAHDLLSENIRHGIILQRID